MSRTFAELAGGAVGTIRLPWFVRVVVRVAFQTAQLLRARLKLPTGTFKTKRLAGFVLVVPRRTGVAPCGLGGHTVHASDAIHTRGTLRAGLVFPRETNVARRLAREILIKPAGAIGTGTGTRKQRLVHPFGTIVAGHPSAGRVRGFPGQARVARRGRFAPGLLAVKTFRAIVAKAFVVGGLLHPKLSSPAQRTCRGFVHTGPTAVWRGVVRPKGARRAKTRRRGRSVVPFWTRFTCGKTTARVLSSCTVHTTIIWTGIVIVRPCFARMTTGTGCLARHRRHRRCGAC